jgi:hypothetical protein
MLRSNFMLMLAFQVVLVGCHQKANEKATSLERQPEDTPLLAQAAPQPEGQPQPQLAQTAITDDQLINTLEAFLALRKEGKHHEAFTELRKEIGRSKLELLVSPVGPSDFAPPDPKYEEAFAKFETHNAKSDALRASGRMKEALDEIWLAIESCPRQATLIVKGQPFSLSSSYDAARSVSGIEELLQFLKSRV